MMTIIIAFNVSYIISFPLALSSLGWFFQNASFDALVSHSVDAHEINECASNFLCAWNDDETAALTPYTTCMCTPIYYYCLPACLALTQDSLRSPFLSLPIKCTSFGWCIFWSHRSEWSVANRRHCITSSVEDDREEDQMLSSIKTGNNDASFIKRPTL